jgi:hypothetical protein
VPELHAGGFGTYSTSGNEVCINNEDSLLELSFTFGYPLDAIDEFEIEGGATYTLSYRARGYVEVEAKIGQANEPYDTLSSFVEIIATNVRQLYTYTAQPTVSETSAGFAFSGVLQPYDSICFDDVSLTKD